jgi:hypothetical protein
MFTLICLSHRLHGGTTEERYRMRNDAGLPIWEKSSYCGTGACVEVRKSTMTVDVRGADGQTLSFSHKAWSQFLGMIKPQS